MPQQLRGNLPGPFNLFHLNDGCAPKTKQRRHEFRCVTNPPAEVTRPSKRNLHFGCTVPLYLEVHSTQGNLQFELVSGAFLIIRETVYDR